MCCEKLKLSENFDFQQLAKKTTGFVRYDLSALTSLARTIAFKRFCETARLPSPPTHSLEIPVEMAVDQVSPPRQSVSVPVAVTPDSGPDAPIQPFRFPTRYELELINKDLDSMYITIPDFLTALLEIRPICARAGFATAPDVTWADIGALGSLKVEMQKAIVQPIKELESVSSMGITAPAGVLLCGPHGCGKTMLAKAIANEIGANFILVRGSDCLYKVRILFVILKFSELSTDQHSSLKNQSEVFIKFSIEPKSVLHVSYSLMSWTL